MPWSVVVGGIYSPNHQNGRWGGCLSMGAPDSPVRHRTLSGAPATLPQPLGFDRWISDSWDHRTVRWCTGQSLFTIRCTFWRLLWLSAHFSRSLFTFADNRWHNSRCSAWHTGQSGATPDSPVNYSGVALQKPEAEQFRVDLPSAPDTVRWHTGQSGAPDQGSLRLVLLLSFWTLTLTFLLVCVEPLAPVEHVI
jgi:hypothetical protein